MTNDECPRLTYSAIAANPEGGLAGKGGWEVRVAWVVGGSCGSSGRCEPHGQRMGGVGAVRAVEVVEVVGGVEVVGVVGGVGTMGGVGMVDFVKVQGL